MPDNFSNLSDSPKLKLGFGALLQWKFSDNDHPWPKKLPNDFVVTQTPSSDRKNFIQFINHATILIDLNGNRLMTDPQFSSHAGPWGRWGPRRHHEVPINVRTLERLDFVLLSHNHYDHMDMGSLRQLEELYQPTFVMPLKNSAYLSSIKIPAERIIELAWWHDYSAKELKITLTPAQHWSKRGIFDRNQALWGSFVVQFENKKIYFAGDTGYADHFKQIHQRFGNFDWAFLPVGAYEPRWFMKYHHQNPMESVQAHLDLHAKQSLGFHHSCFKLTNEGFSAPSEDLKSALEKLNTKNFRYPRPGEIFNL